MAKKRIGIITGGGDCAGLNAVIASIVLSGSQLGYEFVGFEKGWEGILTPVMYLPLDLNTVRGIANQGGTILRTTNKGRFAGKVGSGDAHKIPPEILYEARSHLQELNIEGLILIGGDGTLSAGMQLAETGVKIVGVPKTIDNDIKSTDQTFGFSTAVGVAVEAIDKIHTTAMSHDRTIFVECMGRHTGWIALYAGLAGGADCILIPEFPFDTEQFINYLRQRKEQHFYSSIVVIAEGVKVNNQVSGADTNTSEITLGGVSHKLMHQVEKLAPEEFEMRSVVLGHIQRGGAPNAEDRILSKEYGVAAMEAFQRGEFNVMVAMQAGKMTTVPIMEGVGMGLKKVTEETNAFQTAKKLGIFIS